MSLTISTEHYDRVNNLRTDEVMYMLATRPEKLYPPMPHFTPDPGIIYDLSDILAEKKEFRTVEEALAAIKEWCD